MRNIQCAIFYTLDQLESESRKILWSFSSCKLHLFVGCGAFSTYCLWLLCRMGPILPCKQKRYCKWFSCIACRMLFSYSGSMDLESHSAICWECPHLANEHPWLGGMVEVVQQYCYDYLCYKICKYSVINGCNYWIWLWNIVYQLGRPSPNNCALFLVLEHVYQKLENPERRLRQISSSYSIQTLDVYLYTCTMWLRLSCTHFNPLRN